MGENGNKIASSLGPPNTLIRPWRDCWLYRLNDLYSASALLAIQSAVIVKRDSACLSVRPSRSGIVSRRMKMRLCVLQLLVGQSF